MSNVLKYAVMRYTPSFVAGESINLGVLISEGILGRHEFHLTKKWNRVKAFADELNIEALQIALNDMKKDIETPMYSVAEKFSIDTYIRDFVNELHFSSSFQVPYENIDSKIEEIKKIYLRFNYKPKDRLSNRSELDFVKSMLTVGNYTFERHASTYTKFDSKIRFDFIFENYGIKFFQFKDSIDIGKKIDNMKVWAWNCQHSTDITPIIIYSADEHQMSKDNYRDFQMAISILKEYSKYVFPVGNTYDDFSNLILSIPHSEGEPSILDV